MGKLAEELEMAIAVTFLEKTEGDPRNTLVLFDRFGRKQFVYAKVHTCAFDVEGNLSRGEEFYTAVLDTAAGNVTVGAMICFDREFPESARILMLKGAELILVPNACPMEINRLSQLRARAFENMLAIATCNYPEECRTATGILRCLMELLICRISLVPEIPAFWKQTKKKGFFLPRWIWTDCGGIGRKRCTEMRTAVRTNMGC